MDVQEPRVRADLAARGTAYLGIGGSGKITPEAIDPNLTDTALAVAVQERGTPVVEAILDHLKTERSAVVRSRLLSALNRSRDPAIAARVRSLALSPDLRVNEVPTVAYGAVREPTNLEAGWEWFKANFDAIVERTPPAGRGDLAGIGGRFCTKALRDDYKRFFDGRIDKLTGGPRTMAQVLEQIDACRLLVDKQRRKAEKFFNTRGGNDS
jgi:alanyl aminopeptidase